MTTLIKCKEFNLESLTTFDSSTQSPPQNKSMEIEVESTSENNMPERPSRRNSEAATREALLGALLEQCPNYVRGNKPRLKFGKYKEWEALKEELKREWLPEQWDSFVRGKNPDETSELMEQLTKKLKEKNLSTWMRTHANAYLTDRLKRPQYILSDDRDGAFSSKGTDFASKVYRTQNGECIQRVSHLTPEVRQEIEAEQGTAYTGGKMLGKGSFGKVWIAKRLARGEGQDKYVAEKTCNLFDDGGGKEFSNYKKLHENLKDGSADEKKYFSVTHEFTEAGRAHLFLDLATRGHLGRLSVKIHKLLATQGVDAKKLLRTVCKQLLEAVNVLHKRGIYHGDIKEENFLLSKHGTFMLVDLRMLSTENQGIEGCTPDNLPPEAQLPHDPADAKKSDADKWALGLVLQLFGNGFDKEPELSKIVNNQLLQRTPDRASLDSILDSDYFQEPVYSEKELLEMLDNGQVA